MGGVRARSQRGKCRGTACRARQPTWLSLPLLVAAGLSAQLLPDAQSTFRVQETTIARIHAAFEDRTITCPELVAMYLARIDAYDKEGPSINAIIRVNPRALERARKLQEGFDTKGLTGPLHCVPMIVKDNYDTADMPTTAGSLALADSIPPDDAFQVRKIREAGAIVLAKSNMAEFAFSAYQTVGSFLPGHTRNPYDTRRVPAGSSGGTAAAVASNLGVVGLGTDTGNSIRGPSSHTALVGIRSTMGLTSRDGIVPLNLFADIGGPMARTVEDAVRVFDVIAGYDPADLVTSASRGKKPASYLDSLNPDALQGARIGVASDLLDDDADPRVVQLLENALADMKQAGAKITSSVHIAGYKELADDRPSCRAFEFDLNNYLESLGPGAPFKNLTEIIGSRKFHPSIRSTLERNEGGRDTGRRRTLRQETRLGSPPTRRRPRSLPGTPARRSRLPHMEQSAAADRRSQHTPRQQQQPSLSTHWLSRDHGSDGLRRWLAVRDSTSRRGLFGTNTHRHRLRLRTGDPSPPAAGRHTLNT